MSELLPSIDLGISAKLRDPIYRQAFFLAESSALIAKQLIALRKRRNLSQVQLAQAIETGQPAISRVERADYRNWSFNTLRKMAEAMDGRLRVYIEPAEDVLHEYEAGNAAEGFASAASALTEGQAGQQSVPADLLGSVTDALNQLSRAQTQRMKQENLSRASLANGTA